MSWFKQIAQRLTWAHRALVVDDANPVIRLDNGVSLDLNSNKIILEGNFALHVTGNLSLTADGEVDIRDHINKIPNDEADYKNALSDFVYGMFGVSKEKDGNSDRTSSSESNV